MEEGNADAIGGGNWVKEFAKCPSCGSTNRFFEEIGSEIKERKLAEEEMKFYYDLKSAPMANNEIIDKVPIGGEIPAFSVATDICVECGTVYAVRLEKTTARKGLTLVQVQPNRAQRRHRGNGFQMPSWS